MYSPSRCLVIGGAGMLGYEIAKQLHGRGKEVRIMDLVQAGDNRFEEYTGDIRDTQALKEACRDVDTVSG